jgi:hypothetical protein
MRRTILTIFIVYLVAMVLPAQADTSRVVKVLPHLLDEKGRHTLSPSLYGRDAYQFYLREHPEKCSGVRFDVEWKANEKYSGPVKLRIELRGVARGDLPSKSVLEALIKPGGWFAHWTSLPLRNAEYEKFGKITAWRVSLWDGSRLLSEQQSFLW